MSQQQLAQFVRPVTQSLDDTHTHLSSLSVAYRDVNTNLRTLVDSLMEGTQGFQGNGANTFSSLIDYYIGAVEKHCQALDTGANTAKTCSTQVNNAVDTASSANLDTTIVTYVLGQLTLDDVIRQGRGAIDPIMQDMQKTWQQMQNTWSDLQKTWNHEDKLMNDAQNAADQEWKDLFSGNFGGLGSDIGRYWSDQWQKLGDWWHEGGDYLQLAGQGLHMAWDAIQLAWQTLAQWAEDIFQAIKNCLSAIGSIATTAVQDIKTFLSGIVNDTQRLIDDVQKGDYTDALKEILNDFINPELKMMGLQELEPRQIQDMLPPSFWQWFKNLPTWAKVVLFVVVVLIIIGALIWGTIVKPSNVPRAIKNFQKQSAEQWKKMKPKDRDNTNFGGGQLGINGKDAGNSGFRTSPDPRYPGKHVEEQVIDWALQQIKEFRKTHGNAPLKSLTLDLYTFKTPCTEQHNNCSLKLRPGGEWEQELKQAAGIKNDKDIHITVYTSNGNPGNPIQIWP